MVLASGGLVHVLLAFLLRVVYSGAGIPQVAPVVAQVTTYQDTTCAPGQTQTPARAAGLRPGDAIPTLGKVSALLVLLAAINVFLGLFNLLPILPLDGGHLAVLTYEQVRHKLWVTQGLQGARGRSTSPCCSHSAG